jgi:hypothetical protein
MSVIQVVNAGKIVTTGVASANTTLPTNADNTTRYVRLVATAGCYIRFGDGATTVSSANGLLLAPNFPEVFATGGLKNIAYIDGPGASVTLNMTPVEQAL